MSNLNQIGGDCVVVVERFVPGDLDLSQDVRRNDS